MVDRVRAELADEEIKGIAEVYHSWRGEKGSRPYAHVPGFASSATSDVIRAHKYALVPGRYVGFAERQKDVWDRAELTQELSEIIAWIRHLDQTSKSTVQILKEITNG